jgi:hypothetical protein
MEKPWGRTLIWDGCGHQAVILGDHDLGHEHRCPVCEPDRRAEGCDVEYLDVALSWPGPEATLRQMISDLRPIRSDWLDKY